MSFRCAARVPDRSGLGAACPAVVRRLRYLRRAIICFNVPKFSHPEFPYPSAVACGLVLRPYHEVLFVKRFHAEKPETRKPLHKIYDRASLYRSAMYSCKGCPSGAVGPSVIRTGFRSPDNPTSLAAEPDRDRSLSVRPPVPCRSAATEGVLFDRALRSGGRMTKM